MQRETPHLSDEFIACVWVFMQDGVFPEFKSLVTNGNLPYAKPRGGNSLADVVKNQLPEGFYDASDFALRASQLAAQHLLRSSRLGGRLCCKLRGPCIEHRRRRQGRGKVESGEEGLREGRMEGRRGLTAAVGSG